MPRIMPLPPIAPRSTASSVEALEARIAPAVVTARLVTYTDTDGDLVELRASQSVFTAANLAFVPGVAGGETLELLALGTVAKGAQITFKATTPAGSAGDGFVAVGVIDAHGVDLRSIVVDGALAAVKAGDANPKTPALRSITVESFGATGDGLAMAAPLSVLVGGVSSLNVLGDFGHAKLTCTSTIGFMRIGGSVLGNKSVSNYSGFIEADAFGRVLVAGDIRGGAGDSSGCIVADHNLAVLLVGGSVRGGAGLESGVVSSLLNAGVVRIGGDLQGGTGPQTGRVTIGNAVSLLEVVGSVIGSGHDFTGEIRVTKQIELLRIGGDLRGGDASGSDDVLNTGFVKADSIKAFLVRGSINAGTNDSTGQLINSGSIRTADEIRLGRVVGDLRGTTSLVTGKTTPAVISAEDSEYHDASPASDVALIRLTVDGSVVDSRIEAGYGADGLPVDGNAKIGTLVVKGDWINSTLVAGVQSSNASFGDNDGSDSLIPGRFPSNFSKIRSVVIGGEVRGGIDLTQPSGFMAHVIDRITVKGVPVALSGALDNILIGSAGTANVRVQEL